jgi:hypothetical protein
MRKCDSDLIKEAAHSKGNSTKQVGLELTALRLCGHRSKTDLVTDLLQLARVDVT